MMLGISYEDIMHYIEEHPNKEELENKVDDTIEKYLNKIKRMDYHLYEEIIMDLYIDVYGEHFNKHMAHEAVSGMENEDGTTGEHWSLDETTRLMAQYKMTSEYYNDYDFYYVMNMLYSDFYGVVGNDITTYLKLAKYWLCDKDVAEGKALRYYMKVVKTK